MAQQAGRPRAEVKWRPESWGVGEAPGEAAEAHCEGSVGAHRTLVAVWASAFVLMGGEGSR